MKKSTRHFLGYFVALFFLGSCRHTIIEQDTLRTSTNQALLAAVQGVNCVYSPYTRQNYPIQPSSNTNMMLNAGFENGNFSRWTVDLTGQQLSVGNYPRTGTYGVKLSPTTTTSSAVRQALPYLAKGKTYALSVWVKSAGTSAPSFVDVGFEYRDENGLKQSKFIPSSVAVTQATTAWKQITYSITIPSTLPDGKGWKEFFAVVQVYKQQATAVYIDDIQVLSKGGEWMPISSSVPVVQNTVFYEDFSQLNKLSPNRWLVVKKAWGNGSTLNNNGVVPENIEFLPTGANGGLRLHGHGLNYTGPIMGINGGKDRVGACIATKEYYASGKYEVYAKVTPGMICAFWTFHYIEDPAFQNGSKKNTEIDWETPSNCQLSTSLCGKTLINDANANTWGGLCDGEGVDNSGAGAGSSYQVNLPFASGVTDAANAYHLYTIEWHTGGGGIQPSIKWYFDNVLVKTETKPTYVGFRAARFWVGVWYGNANWIGSNTLNYSDKYMDVKSVKITPYNEPNDKFESETDPFIGYAPPIYSVYKY